MTWAIQNNNQTGGILKGMGLGASRKNTAYQIAACQLCSQNQTDQQTYLMVVTFRSCLQFCSWARLKAENEPYKNPLGSYLAFLRILCNSRWRPKWLPKYKNPLFELVIVVESHFFGLLSAQCVSHDRLGKLLVCEMYIYMLKIQDGCQNGFQNGQNRQYLMVLTFRCCLQFCPWARLKAKNEPHKNPLGAYLAILRILCNSRWRPKWLPKYKDLFFELVIAAESHFFGLLSM